MNKIIIIENYSLALETNRKELINKLSEDNKVIIFCLTISNKNIYRNLINSENITLHELNFLSFPRLIYHSIGSKAILTFTVRPLIIGSLIKIFFPFTKFFPTITGTGQLTDSKHLIYKLLRIVQPIILRLADNIFFHNKTDAIYCCDNNNIKKSIVVGGSGISIPTNLPKYTPYNHSSRLPKIGCFARLLVDKGILVYLEATSLIFKHYPETKGNIFLAGHYYRETLRSNKVKHSSIKKWEESGGVFIGQPSDKESFYSSLDILCHPSFREGLSNVLLEGGASGCILLTTSAPGCVDVIGDNGGITCEPKSVESLYKSLVKAINLSSEEQIKFRDNCFKRLNNLYSKSKVIETYRKVIGKEIKNESWN